MAADDTDEYAMDAHRYFLDFSDAEVAALAIALGLSQAALDAGWTGLVEGPRPAPGAQAKLKAELEQECRRRGLLGIGQDALGL